jgi:hypothetical protein
VIGVSGIVLAAKNPLMGPELRHSVLQAMVALGSQAVDESTLADARNLISSLTAVSSRS